MNWFQRFVLYFLQLKHSNRGIDKVKFFAISAVLLLIVGLFLFAVLVISIYVAIFALVIFFIFYIISRFRCDDSSCRTDDKNRIDIIDVDIVDDTPQKKY